MAIIKLPNEGNRTYTTQVGPTVISFVDGVAHTGPISDGTAHFLKINGYGVTRPKTDDRKKAEPAGPVVVSETKDAEDPKTEEELGDTVKDEEPAKVTDAEKGSKTSTAKKPTK